MIQELDECIIDPRKPGPSGYVPVSYRVAGIRFYTNAHRQAWEKAFGLIPAGMLVCHKCDNRACINPSHLFLGSNKDNTQDMVGKKRHWNQQKDVCKHGHPFTEERDARNRRVCKECDRARRD